MTLAEKIEYRHKELKSKIETGDIMGVPFHDKPISRDKKIYWLDENITVNRYALYGNQDKAVSGRFPTMQEIDETEERILQEYPLYKLYYEAVKGQHPDLLELILEYLDSAKYFDSRMVFVLDLSDTDEITRAALRKYRRKNRYAADRVQTELCQDNELDFVTGDAALLATWYLHTEERLKEKKAIRHVIYPALNFDEDKAMIPKSKEAKAFFNTTLAHEPNKSKKLWTEWTEKRKEIVVENEKKIQIELTKNVYNIGEKGAETKKHILYALQACPENSPEVAFDGATLQNIFDKETLERMGLCLVAPFLPEPFDSRIFFSICSLIKSHGLSFTLGRLCEVVFGKSYNKDQEEYIAKRIILMDHALLIRQVIYTDPETGEVTLWKESSGVSIRDSEKKLMARRFRLLPLRYADLVINRGRPTIEYTFWGMPDLFDLWTEVEAADNLNVNNVPYKVLKTLFRRDNETGVKIQNFVDNTVLPMKRKKRKPKPRKRKAQSGAAYQTELHTWRNRTKAACTFSYEVILFMAGIDFKDAQKALTCLEKVLREYKEMGVHGVYDFFLDDVTKKLYVFKHAEEKEIVLKGDKELKFIGEHRNKNKKMPFRRKTRRLNLNPQKVAKYK